MNVYDHLDNVGKGEVGELLLSYFKHKRVIHQGVGEGEDHLNSLCL